MAEVAFTHLVPYGSEARRGPDPAAALIADGQTQPEGAVFRSSLVPLETHDFSN